MKVTITPDNNASLTAQTVNGPVTIPLRAPDAKMPFGVWRKFASHAVRPRFQLMPCGSLVKSF